MEKNYEKLSDMIKHSRKTVFFGGAGISTESGIPDFRSSCGIYSEKYGGLPPERIVSGTFFKSNPEMFFDFYKEKLIFPEAKPGSSHITLSKLEKAGFLDCVITQNIDGLHQAAGSRNVIELHGSIHRNYCIKCGKKYPLGKVTETVGVPICSCGGIIRPDVTLFDEALPEGAFEAATEKIFEADLLIVGGTSLSVYPAASLVRYLVSGKLIIINLTETGADHTADLLIHSYTGEALKYAALLLGIQ